MSVDLVDKEGTIIQATCFGDIALITNEKLMTDQVYTFSGGRIQLANKKFTSIKNDYCITFDQ